MWSRTTSAIDRALWRTLATSAEKSWTPPMKMLPSRIQASAGAQPKATPARIGPTTGPAAAMAEKCCPSRSCGGIGA